MKTKALHVKKSSLSPLVDILSNYDFITNAIIFGSYASHTHNKLSDIDIAIHTQKDIDLLTLGEIISKLESQLKRKVDLVILNDLYKKSPLLCYNIYKSHKIIFVNNEEKYKKFKLNSLHYYMDFEPIIAQQNRAFLERIDSGTIGKTKTA